MPLYSQTHTAPPPAANTGDTMQISDLSQPPALTPTWNKRLAPSRPQLPVYPLIRPLLFRLEPERAHHLTVSMLRLASQMPLGPTLLRMLFDAPADPRLEVEAFGLKFKNPVGLAAGYDKAGVAVKGLSCLGFGHVEVGTLTLRPQIGNPRPRVHRLPEQGAVINSMGFPNPGVDTLNLKRGAFGQMRVGINIGKGKDQPLDRAAEDYCELFRRVHPQADYIALNVSCPNMVDLHKLQQRGPLTELLHAITATRDSLAPRLPLLLKLSPDLTEAEIDDTLTAVFDSGVDGIIATNTSTGRAGVPSHAAGLKGGLSGAPLRTKSTEFIRYLSHRTEGKLPIVGLGGIGSAADALEKLRAGATLVQIFTGMIYAGPSLVREINEGILQAKSEGW
jgi:dihydroorotate dehydrogenase